MNAIVNRVVRSTRRWVRRKLWSVAELFRSAAERWARFVLRCSDEKLERHIASRMFLRGLPFALQRKFRGKDAVVEGEDVTALIEMEIRHGEDARVPLAISIHRRRCTIRKMPVSNPDVAMSLRLADLIRMVSGAVDGPMLMAEGRMKVSGDPFLLARFPGLFGLRTRSLLQ